MRHIALALSGLARILNSLDEIRSCISAGRSLEFLGVQSRLLARPATLPLDARIVRGHSASSGRDVRLDEVKILINFCLIAVEKY